MDVKTQALDRVLEAISPSLSAELDRVTQETRESLEEEFQRRLEATVRDVENAAASAGRADLEKAVEQSKEDTRREITSELEKQFAEKLDAITDQVRSEGGQEVAKLVDTIAQIKKEAAEERTKLEGAMTQLKNEWSEELTKVEDERDRWRMLAEAEQKFAEASSQSEMLIRFLSSAQSFARGLAIYVAKADGLDLWKSKGDGAFPKILSKEATDADSYFRTITVRGKSVCAIYAYPTFHLESLNFLVASLERAIEAFGLKLRASAPKQAV
jgi:exonuclease VII large subunit